MKRLLSYTLWNLFITGTLFLGYTFNVMHFTGTIIGILYGIILAILLVTVLCLNDPDLHDKLKAINSSIRYVTIVPDILFMIGAFYMQYTKIGICEFIELILYTVIYIKLGTNKKEN